MSSRENGADSILDLGLLEAPEKAQVNPTSLFLTLLSTCKVIQFLLIIILKLQGWFSFVYYGSPSAAPIVAASLPGVHI